MGRDPRGGAAVLRPLAACVLGICLPTTAAWATGGGWDWYHHDDACYLRYGGDHGDDPFYDRLDTWCEDWDDDHDGKVEIPCEYFCDDGCTKDAATWCEKLTYGADWPKPEWEYGQVCGTTFLDLLCSTGQTRFDVLAREFIATVLNKENGTCVPDPVHDDLVEAYGVLDGCVVSAGERAAADRLALVLGAYNRGKVGPGSCRTHHDEDDCDWWDLHDWFDPDCLDEWFDHHDACDDGYGGFGSYDYGYGGYDRCDDDRSDDHSSDDDSSDDHGGYDH